MSSIAIPHHNPAPIAPSRFCTLNLPTRGDSTVYGLPRYVMVQLVDVSCSRIIVACKFALLLNQYAIHVPKCIRCDRLLPY